MNSDITKYLPNDPTQAATHITSITTHHSDKLFREQSNFFFTSRHQPAMPSCREDESRRGNHCAQNFKTRPRGVLRSIEARSGLELKFTGQREAGTGLPEKSSFRRAVAQATEGGGGASKLARELAI